MGAIIEQELRNSKVRRIHLTYNHAESHTSALRLVLTLRPEWQNSGGNIEFIRFTDGITNTLLKVVNKKPGLAQEEIDNEAILLRAYGQGTDKIIDRKRETQNHELLMQHNLAPELLARFNNGMLYRFIQGKVTSPADLRREEIWRAVARRLGQWHALVPCIPSSQDPVSRKDEWNEAVKVVSRATGKANLAMQRTIDNVAPGKPAPNVWTVMQKWIYALPTGTRVEKSRQGTLQTELNKIVAEFSHREGLGENSLVFAHCDLLSGNIIIQPRTSKGPRLNAEEVVSFIDYEYATPSPAAFDIANHFAEWGGFDCEHHLLPTRSQRRDFIGEYLRSYFAHKKQAAGEDEVSRLFMEVDNFRGIPGFYWGIWALIQATSSQIDFDYASYAEIRLGEYWAWRDEQSGSRAASGKDIPVREKRWAQED